MSMESGHRLDRPAGNQRELHALCESDSCAGLSQRAGCSVQYLIRMGKESVSAP